MVTTPPIGAVSTAAAFLREHLAEPLTLADVADEVGYSRFHLARIFSAQVGMSPIRFLAGLRFHHAKQLLLLEDLSIVDVCHEVGFSSPGTFTRRFRAEVGVPPGALRRLADDLAETTPTPFHRRPPSRGGQITGWVEPPLDAGPEALVWIGVFSRPVPSGLPGAGLLRHGAGEFALPLVPGHPWLLATVVSRSADPVTQLAPDVPQVAVHPSPLVAPERVTLSFREAHPWEPPILTALPALRTIGVS